MTPAERVARFMHDFTIEVVPRELAAGGRPIRALAPGTKLYLTRLPKAPFAETVVAAQRARALGFRAVPHLTARTIRDRHELERDVRALVAAGVEEVLVISGSQARPVGNFESTMDVLETGIFEAAGIARIGVAGHPEGVPGVPDEALQTALERKNAFAERSGIALHVVTQFFFDAEPVIRWERRIRALGNRLPIHLGFHGVTSSAGLLRHAVACGIGDSINMLARNANVLQLTVMRSPDRLLSRIALAAGDDPDSRFTRAHFFPLGGLERTVAWANDVAGGRFALGPDGSIAPVRGAALPS